MMPETIPSFEQKPQFLLNERIFGELDEFSKKLQGKDKKRLVEEIIDVKKDAFEYAGGFLDNLSVEAEQKEAQGQKVDRPSHNIIISFEFLGHFLKKMKVELGWPQEQSKKWLLMKGAALQYALKTAEAYKEAVEEKRMEPSKVLESLGLVNVIDPKYLENNILNKISKLPEVIRENLFKVKKQ